MFWLWYTIVLQMLLSGEIRTSVQRFSLHYFLQLLVILQLSQFFKKLLHMERAMSTGRKGWKWHLWMCGPELVHMPFFKSVTGASACHPSLQIRKTSSRNVGRITAIIVTLFFQAGNSNSRLTRLQFPVVISLILEDNCPFFLGLNKPFGIWTQQVIITHTPCVLGTLPPTLHRLASFGSCI